MRYMQGILLRLAGEEHHVGAAREARRVREQHGVARRARREGACRRRGDRRRRERHVVALEPRRGPRDRGRDVGGRHRAATQVVVARRAVGQLDLEDARSSEGGDDQGPRRQAQSTTSRCGITWRCRKARSASTPTTRRPTTAGCRRCIHVDTDAPLYSDRDGRLITDKLWGLYYKPDFHFGGVQGGAMPAAVDRPADEVRVDPYGPKSPEFVVDRQLRRHVDVGARVLPEALRRPARRISQGALGRHRLLHARQLSGVRPLSRERVRHRRFQPRLQDDRRGRPRRPTSSWAARVRCSSPSAFRATRKAGCIR